MFILSAAGPIGSLDEIYRELNMNPILIFSGNGGLWSYKTGYNYDPDTSSFIMYKSYKNIENLFLQLKEKYFIFTFTLQEF
jgi:hypothetical protein